VTSEELFACSKLRPASNRRLAAAGCRSDNRSSPPRCAAVDVTNWAWHDAAASRPRQHTAASILSRPMGLMPAVSPSLQTRVLASRRQMLSYRAGLVSSPRTTPGASGLYMACNTRPVALLRPSESYRRPPRPFQRPHSGPLELPTRGSYALEEARSACRQQHRISCMGRILHAHGERLSSPARRLHSLRCMHKMRGATCAAFRLKTLARRDSLRADVFKPCGPDSMAIACDPGQSLLCTELP